jgi:uncharacterized protein (DUF1697 family)
MSDLVKTFEEMKLENVKTYIQSGNVIFTAAEKDRSKLTAAIEKALTNKYGFDARIVLLTLAEMKKIVAAIPDEWGADSGYRHDVWFLRETLTVDEVMRNVRIRDGVDKVHGGKKVVYASRLISHAGKSNLPKIIQLPLYQNMTIRNRNTTMKLLELMENREGNL